MKKHKCAEGENFHAVQGDAHLILHEIKDKSGHAVPALFANGVSFSGAKMLEFLKDALAEIPGRAERCFACGSKHTIWHKNEYICLDCVSAENMELQAENARLQSSLSVTRIRYT